MKKDLILVIINKKIKIAILLMEMDAENQVSMLFQLSTKAISLELELRPVEFQLRQNINTIKLIRTLPN